MSETNSDHKASVGSSDDDFVLLDAPQTLAVRDKQIENRTTPHIQLSSLPNEDAFLVSVQPPASPLSAIKHVPCDIVLVIDVSGSMAELAPIPDTTDESEQESAGLSVLDLVRHACRTIISTLNEGDRLSLITFANDVQVVQELQTMTEENKSDVMTKIEKLKAHGATNLWAGIKAGLKQFEQTKSIGDVQGLFILTDGMPNYMCPPQGYIPKLKPVLDELATTSQSTPTIQTFGFGYSIRSDLMLSISEAGNGNFAFIPEVGMIGTVFVHAVANLYSTFATNAKLDLKLVGSKKALLSHDSGLPVQELAGDRLQINLGNLLYGQSRDIVVKHSSGQATKNTFVDIELAYNSSHLKVNDTVNARCPLGLPPTFPPSVLSYHLTRNELCRVISTLYPLKDRDEHQTVPIADVTATKTKFDDVAQRLVSIPQVGSDQDLSSLLADIVGAELDLEKPEQGQIYQALQTAPVTKGPRIFKSYWERWGRHYLSSLWCAHMRQTCNSFKDPGPLRYGVNSKLFQQCRDELDAAFDNLPPPKGTWVRGTPRAPFTGAPWPAADSNNAAQPQARSKMSTSSVNMSRWNRRDNPCFLGSCPVTLANGRMMRVDALRPGIAIKSPLASKSMKILAVVKTPTSKGTELCRIGSDLWITSWHPILNRISEEWVFPRDIAEAFKPLYNHEPVYSILLEPSDEVDAHTVEVGGISCVTLGHGLLEDVTGDIRAHPFFGNYQAVESSLSQMWENSQMHRLCYGLVKDHRSGLTCGFVPAAMSMIDLCAREAWWQDWTLENSTRPEGIAVC